MRGVDWLTWLLSGHGGAEVSGRMGRGLTDCGFTPAALVLSPTLDRHRITNQHALSDEWFILHISWLNCKALPAINSGLKRFAVVLCTGKYQVLQVYSRSFAEKNTASHSRGSVDNCLQLLYFLLRTNPTFRSIIRYLEFIWSKRWRPIT